MTGSIVILPDAFTADISLTRTAFASIYWWAGTARPSPSKALSQSRSGVHVNLSDEIEKLGQLHASGALTDAEFAQAKQNVLSRSAPTPTPPQPDDDEGLIESMLDGSDKSLGGAANRYVSFQMVMAVIGLILAAIFFFGFFLPQWKSFGKQHDEMRQDFDQKWDQLAPH